MAVILNLETATTNCSVSVARDGQLLALVEENHENYSHSENLHVFIDRVLADASLSTSDLDAIAVSKGPGSYTGLRIGVSAAKGLSFALGIPLISIPTLQSLALQITPQEGELIIALLDARRMEVYSQVFDAQHASIRETKAEIITESSFAAYSKAPKVYLVGNGAAKCQEVLAYPNVEYQPLAVPSAKEMAGLSFQKFQAGQLEDVAYFEPFYLKDFVITTKK